MHRRLTFHADERVDLADRPDRGRRRLAVLGLVATSAALGWLDAVAGSAHPILQISLVATVTAVIGVMRFVALRWIFRPTEVARSSSLTRRADRSRARPATPVTDVGRLTEPPSPCGRAGAAARRRPLGPARRSSPSSAPLVAVLLFGRISAPIGPFDATLAFRPTLDGGAAVAVPPLGALTVDVYDGPLRLDIALQRVDQDRARALANDPVRLAGVVDQVSDDLRGAVVRLAWTTAGVAIAGAALTSFVVLRRRRSRSSPPGSPRVLLLGTAGLGAATWRPEALSAPTYTGLLVNANSLIGSAEDIVARFDAYRASLEDLVANVGSLYATISALPAPGGTDETVALLHVSDLHLNPAGFDLVRQVVDQFEVDGVLDTGDITDWGSEPENRLITSVGDARRALRLHPRQPRLRGDGGADRRAAQRHGARRHGHHGGRDRDRRRRGPALHPRQDAPGTTTTDDEVLVQTGETLAEVAEEQPEPPVDRPGPRPEAGPAAGRRRPPDPRRAHARPRASPSSRTARLLMVRGLHRRRRAARRSRASIPSR